MKKLIVNADDLGRTRGINEGVFEAHGEGIVTSATAMVNYPGIEEAARLSRSHPRLGIGLHVALSGGVPALPPESIDSLVGSSGSFPSKPEGHTSPRQDQLMAEIEAQYQKFLKVFGRKPTHLDSHHHSHRRGDVFNAVTALARRERLPVRNCGGDMGERLRQLELKTTDAFSEEFFDEGVSSENLVRIVSELRDGSTELMCHPAREDAELLASSSYASRRTVELAVLKDAAVRRAVEAASVSLVTFAEL